MPEEKASSAGIGGTSTGGTGIGTGTGSGGSSGLTPRTTTNNVDSSNASAGGSSVGSLPDCSTTATPELSVLERIYHRTVSPTDLPKCNAIESASYPPDEAASLETLQYRQHHAAPYFKCAVLLPSSGIGSQPTDSMKMAGEIVGFVTGTRCNAFNVQSMSVHDPHGNMLAIHSVVVSEEYRHQGIGSKMLREYVNTMRKMNVKTPIDKIVLIAKADKLAFYVMAGFCVVGVSPIVHGREVWYECSCDLTGGGGLSRGGGGAAAAAAAAAAGSQSSRDLIADGGAGGSGSGGSGTDGTSGGVDNGEAAASSHSAAAGGASSAVALAAGGGGGCWESTAATMAGKPCFVVDSFADPSRPGSGNPAAVVYMGESSSVDSVGEREEEWMRTVAMEFNLSETAFLWDRRRGDGATSALWSGDEVGYDIRYYTKSGAEVDLCGHATLAAAAVVLRVAAEDTSRPTEVKGAVFYAKKDVLKASAVVDDRPASSGSSVSSLSSLSPPSMRIVMDFPWRSVREVDAQADRDAVISMLDSAFGLGNDDSVNGDILYIGMDNVGEDLLIELTPEAFVRVGPADSSLVNIAALGCWGGGYTRGVILCCRIAKDKKDEGGGIDFLSRFFGPKAGIDEDPVTGSAHCTLGPYFGAKIGRSRVVGRQTSSRGGIVECVLLDGGGEGEGRPRRVSIAGTAVTTVRGSLFI